MTTWYFSDPHFGHANIIKHSHRPFGSVEAMNNNLETAYREAVKPRDWVWWLGDCFWGGFDGAALLRRLPGGKALVRGNHDRSAAAMLRLGFDAVYERVHRTIGPHTVLMCHYPPKLARYEGREHDDRFNGLRPDPNENVDYFIHGHTHERLRIDGKRIHVGVDAWDYRPVAQDELLELMSR